MTCVTSSRDSYEEMTNVTTWNVNVSGLEGSSMVTML